MIKFMKKRASSAHPTCRIKEIRISQKAPSKSRAYPYIVIRISQRALTKIAPFGAEYLTVGQDLEFPSRIYFAVSTQEDGFRVSHCKGESAMRLVPGKFYPDMSFGISGDYSLEFDSETGLTYIDMMKKENA